MCSVAPEQGPAESSSGEGLKCEKKVAMWEKNKKTILGQKFGY